MSLMDPYEVSVTVNRLSAGVQLNEVIDYVQRVISQTLQASDYASKGVGATITRPHTLDITSPHGDIFCEGQHVRWGDSLAARIVFSATRRDFDGRVSGHEILSAVVTADWCLEKIDDKVATGRFGPSARGDDVLVELIVLMFAKQQGGLDKV
ncbi:hypothetical protein [Burkholderia vietnamiensis]|uniref:hypothetical protein n=1 Tax=Burkholderia vietnamiensis TaxID=60552 RepID=UPI00075C9DBF|nr:hypothetical protein [Burkholderia vietnamiensis]